MKTLTKKTKKTHLPQVAVRRAYETQYTILELQARKQELQTKLVNNDTGFTGFYQEQIDIIEEILKVRFSQKVA